MDTATTPKKGFHYAWWILIACCFMYAGSMALINSIISVYVLPVTEALGVGRGNFTFMLTTQAISIIIAMPIWGSIFQNDKININLAMTIGAICMICCPLMCSFATNLIVFYIAGFIGGIGIACCFTMVTPVLCGNWFVKKYRGKMIGIASAFAGVSTIFWAPLFRWIIAEQGYQFSYLINALLMAILILPWTLFVIKRKPADKGLKPFGWTAEDEVAETADESAEKVDEKAGSDLSFGVKAANAIRTPAFWIILLGVMLTALGMGWNNSQSGIAKELLAGTPEADSAAIVGATMVSAAALGNLISKLAMGAMIDKCKLGITFAVFQAVWLCAFLLWYFAGTTSAVLIAGGFCLGFCNAPSRVGWAVAVRRVFGNADYSKIWGYVATGSSLVGGFSTSIMGWTYDAVGSYMPTLIAGMIIVILIAVLACIASTFEGKYKWEKIEPTK